MNKLLFIKIDEGIAANVQQKCSNDRKIVILYTNLQAHLWITRLHVSIVTIYEYIRGRNKLTRF